MTTHTDISYIKHILEAIEDIQQSVKGISITEFSKNKDIRDANIRRLEIIGEAVKNTSKKLKDTHEEVAWVEIIGTRDKIIHHYFGVNLEIVWDIIVKDLPKLKKQIEKIEHELSQEK